MPRLQAEDALREVERIAIGSGNVAKSARQATLRRWRRHAEGEAPAMVPSLAALGAAGIGVRRVKPKGSDDGR